MRRVAVVTGAAMGNGLKAAAYLCEAGFAVMMCDRSRVVFNEAKRLSDEGYRAEGFLCDISDRESIEETVSRIMERRGRIDVLVNSTGVARSHPFTETEEGELDYYIMVNLKGSWNMTQAVVPYMVGAGCGRIIMISPDPEEDVSDQACCSAYAMTKAGIIGLTRALAMEYAGNHITVNAICPGYFMNHKRNCAQTILSELRKSILDEREAKCL